MILVALYCKTLFCSLVTLCWFCRTRWTSSCMYIWLAGGSRWVILIGRLEVILIGRWCSETTCCILLIVADWLCYLQTLVLRDYWLCMVLSILFEVCEYTLQHQLPNFSECWWDHVSTEYQDFIYRRLQELPLCDSQLPSCVRTEGRWFCVYLVDNGLPGV